MLAGLVGVFGRGRWLVAGLVALALVAAGVVPPAEQARAVEAEEPATGEADAQRLADAQTAVPASALEPVAEGEELVGLRTRFSRTVVGEDGSREAQISSFPLHYRADGRWEAIDNTLVASPRAEQRWRNAANSFTVDLPEQLDTAPVRFAARGAWVSFAPRQAAPVRGQQAGVEVTYDGAVPGVELAYRVEANGLKESLILPDASAPSQTTFDVSHSPGLSTRLDAAGAVEFVDADARVVFAFAAPFAFDASGSPDGFTDAVGYELVRESATTLAVTVSLDQGWLADPARVFPVTVDPQVVLDTDPDTTIRSNDTGASAADRLWVGYDSVTGVNRALLDFDVEQALPRNVQVRRAVVQLELLQATGASSQRTVNAHALTRGFGNLATWTNARDGQPWTTPGGDHLAELAYTGQVSQASGGKHWYPTQLVSDWVDQDVAEHGLLLRAGNESYDGWMAFASAQHPDPAKRPFLIVGYEDRLGAKEAFTFDTRQLTDRASLQVNVGNRNVVHTVSDLRVNNAVGHAATVERTYNSMDTVPLDQFGYSVGRGWRLNVGPGHHVREQLHGQAVYTGPSGQWPFTKTSHTGTKLTAPAGLNATLERDPFDADKFTLTFLRSKQRLIFRRVFPGSEHFTLRRHVDRSGNALVYAYETAAPYRLTTITDTQNRQITFSYLGGSELVDQVTETATGRTIDYTYDTSNTFLVGVTDAGQHTTTYGYTGDGQLESITDGRATPGVTRLAYEQAADGTLPLASLTHVMGDGTEETTRYASSGYQPGECADSAPICAKITVTDARGNATVYTADAQARIIKTTDALGHSRETSYGPNDNVLSFTGARAGATPTTVAYDPSGINPTKVTQPSGGGTDAAAVSVFDYGDANSNNPYAPTGYTRPHGAPTSYSYDAAGRLASIKNGATAPDEYAYSYHPNGTLDCATTPKGSATTLDDTDHKTCFVYNLDPDADVDRVDPPAPLGATLLAHDAVSRVIERTDGKNQTSRYTYDRLDRVTTITYADGSKVEYDYDANGNRTAQRRYGPAGALVQEATYAYDARNRLTAETLPGGLLGGLLGGQTNRYAYDDVGNLVAVDDGNGEVVYRYNQVDLVIGVAEPGGNCDPAVGPLQACTEFGYNDDDQRTTTSYPNGVEQTADYDMAGRLTELYAERVAADGTRTLLTRRAYSYNRHDSSCQEEAVETNLRYVETHGPESSPDERVCYAYDDRTRLVAADAATGADYAYGYDPNSNRTSQTVNQTTTTATFNQADQLVSDGQTSFGYDANGNQTSRTDNTGTTGFTYDVRDATVQIDPPSDPAVSFSYLGAEQVQRLTRDRVAYTNTVLGVTAASDTGITTSWTREPAGGLVGQRRGGDGHYYLFDALGSVIAVTDDQGRVTNRYDYTPYGQTSDVAGGAETGASPVAQPWGYTGAQHDPQFGLDKMGARYYQPDLGRWTQTDPAQRYANPAQPGEINPYVYVGCNPTNLTDPSGMHVGGYLCYLPPYHKTWWIEGNYVVFKVVDFAQERMPLTFVYCPAEVPPALPPFIPGPG